MKTWEIIVTSTHYVRAENEEEARAKFRWEPCSDSSDTILSIESVEEDQSMGGMS